MDYFNQKENTEYFLIFLRINELLFRFKYESEKNYQFRRLFGWEILLCAFQWSFNGKTRKHSRNTFVIFYTR
jgi:hypothetical protein